MTETAEAYKQRILGYVHGIHSERGVETVADTAALYAGHPLSHLRQITATLDQGNQ